MCDIYVVMYQLHQTDIISFRHIRRSNNFELSCAMDKLDGHCWRILFYFFVYLIAMVFTVLKFSFIQEIDEDKMLEELAAAQANKLKNFMKKDKSKLVL